ncbi:hypothetical protein EE612_026119 [Oryza sativa]|nr:hypothetical protein EE612_026119 [Oryza sativa]
MKTLYFPWCLNTLKKTAVCSCRSPEAMTMSPNGPTPPCAEAAPLSLHSLWGSSQSGSKPSASSSRFGISNTTSTSAWELATPTISCRPPAFTSVPCSPTRFVLSVSISSTGHCSSCFPSPSSHTFLGNACTAAQDIQFVAESDRWRRRRPTAHADSCARRRTTWRRTPGRSRGSAISGSCRRGQAPPARRCPPRRRTAPPCRSPGACRTR